MLRVRGGEVDRANRLPCLVVFILPFAFQFRLERIDFFDGGIGRDDAEFRAGEGDAFVDDEFGIDEIISAAP